MRAYAEEYLNDVVENQGKLFDFVAQQYSDKDTEEFINTYMASKTRKSIDEAKAYVNTMDAKELWAYFTETENYRLKDGKALEGFMLDRRILRLLPVVLQPAECRACQENPHILFEKGVCRTSRPGT